MNSTVTTPLLTADEFLAKHGDDSGIELVDGVIVRCPVPGNLHGVICANAAYILMNHVKPRKLGRVMTNDSFIRLQSNPGRVRGSDLTYVSFETLPENVTTPQGAISPPIELVVEVRSPSDSISDMTNKAMEYIQAGVRVVLILDPTTGSAGVFRADELPQRFHNGDVLTMPDILPGFSVSVSKFFES